LVVTENAANPEIARTRLFGHPGYLSHTLDPNFLGPLVWRRDQNLNSNISSNRWTPAAQNERTVQRDIGCEAAPGLLRPVVPVKNDWQS
jgi:hypothetical protein